MEDLKKSFLVRGDNIIGALGDKNFSTLHIGCVIPYAGNIIPRGYLHCDGASYKVADYPDLYAVIGNTYGGSGESFNVPDYRETVLVGTGENTTDTIANHDVYAIGEFKDDQMQGHWHNLGNSNGTVTVSLGASIKGSETRSAASDAAENRYLVDTALDAITDGTNGTPRVGTTTHGKQKGVTYIIKAFHTNEGVDSGVSDDVVEYVESGLAKKESVYITNDPSGSGVLYNAAEYLGVNAVDTYGLYNLVVTTDTGESGECNFIYKHRVAIYGNIISENGVTFDNLNEYGTIVVNSTSANRTFKIKYLGEPTEDMSGLSKYEYTRANKNALERAVSSKADRQLAVRNTDYLKPDRAYLKIVRNGNLSHVPYYACETYILCNHLGNMGALSFIRTDSGASCVYKDIVGTLSLSVELHDEYVCWLKYSSTSSEIITVYALNGYTPTVSSATSMT